MKQLQLVNIIQLILIFQSLCFCLFLITQKRGELISNKFLAAFLGVLSLQMSLNFLFETNSQIRLPDITPTLGFL
jgi:L-cystine uptake protein TcyP (sodium:dicarboxylate symporter family)